MTDLTLASLFSVWGCDDEHVRPAGVLRFAARSVTFLVFEGLLGCEEEPGFFMFATGSSNLEGPEGKPRKQKLGTPIGAEGREARRSQAARGKQAEAE